jgi:hypothetical protein
MSSHEPIISHEQFIPIKHMKELHLQNCEDDDTLVTRKRRQRTTKSFGDDYIVYLVDDTRRNIEETYSSPDADFWKEVVRTEMIQLCLMEL